ADLAEGPVTSGEVYEVMPFDNQIMTMRLTGAEIDSVLEQGLRGLGTVQVSGLRYVFDRTRPPGHRVISIEREGGRPLDPAATYLVATNDFMAQGGDGYRTFSQGRDLTRTGVLVRQAMEEDLAALDSKGKPLDVPLSGRIRDLAPVPPPTEQKG